VGYWIDGQVIKSSPASAACLPADVLQMNVEYIVTGPTAEAFHCVPASSIGASDRVGE